MNRPNVNAMGRPLSKPPNVNMIPKYPNTNMIAKPTNVVNTMSRSNVNAPTTQQVQVITLPSFQNNKPKTGFMDTMYTYSLYAQTSVYESRTMLSIFIVCVVLILIALGLAFYRDYSSTRSYVGDITGKQLANSGGDICQPYIRCMKEEGKRWFERMDNHKLCQKCTEDNQCPDYITGQCKSGDCYSESRGDEPKRNMYCDAMKPHGKPCSGFLQKSAPHCEIGDVYTLRNSQIATDEVGSYLPFNISEWIPMNPFQRLQNFTFGSQA